jgi:hypothetical protein
MPRETLQTPAFIELLTPDRTRAFATKFSMPGVLSKLAGGRV